MTTPWLALAATLLVQMQVTMTLVAAAVLAPAVAPTLGISPARIGLYAAVAYLAAMFVGLRAGQGVARWGAVALSQAALLASAAGAVLAAASPWLGTAPGLLAAAVLIGIGYGLVNPAAAAILTHHAPGQARGLFFSIKQTGVPIGVAAAGLSMPAGLAALGWRGTAVALGSGCLLLAAALGPLVRRLEPPSSDRDDGPSCEAPDGGAWALLQRVWRTPALRRLSLASLAYAGVRQVFVTFLVSLLNLQLGWTLAAAAGVLAASQAVAAGARIGFGALADRWGRPGRLLVWLGVAMSMCCLALAAAAGSGGGGGGGVGVGVGVGVPPALVVALALSTAATAMGWNGVFFADLAQRVVREDMARVSGATQFFTFAGGMLGPLLFGEALRAGAGYAVGYAALALVPLWAAWGLRRS